MSEVQRHCIKKGLQGNMRKVFNI